MNDRVSKLGRIDFKENVITVCTLCNSMHESRMQRVARWHFFPKFAFEIARKLLNAHPGIKKMDRREAVNCRHRILLLTEAFSDGRAFQPAGEGGFGCWYDVLTPLPRFAHYRTVQALIQATGPWGVAL
jgi:hypothetical protein